MTKSHLSAETVGKKLRSQSGTLLAQSNAARPKPRTDDVLPHRDESRLSEMAANVTRVLTLPKPFSDKLRESAEAIRTGIECDSVDIWSFNKEKDNFNLEARTLPSTAASGVRSADRGRNYNGKSLGRSTSSNIDRYPLKSADVMLGVVVLYSQRPLSKRAKPLLESVINSLALAMDHNTIKESLLETQESSLLARSALESTANGVAITDTRGNIEWVNTAFSTLTGYTLDEARGKNPRVLKSGKTPESVYRELWSTISNGDVWKGDIINRRKDGQLYHEEMTIAPVRDSHGTIAHFVAIKQDVTLRKSLEAKLRHRTLHDPLTQLANRVLFHDRLSHSLDRSKRERTQTSVLFLDLDNFKIVNDTLGHGPGDELLKGVAKRLLSCIRSTDTAARFGGDEFAVLIDSSFGSEGPIRIAESIRENMREPFILNGKEAFVGCSIGIASTNNGEESPEDLLRDADVAMYIAKHGGKDRYAVFTPEMHDEIVRRAEMR